MSEATGVIPLALARALGDAKNEVRRKAAAEIGDTVRIYLKDMYEGETHINSILASLTTFFVRSAQVSRRKGGLNALSVIAVAAGPVGSGEVNEEDDADEKKTRVKNVAHDSFMKDSLDIDDFLAALVNPVLLTLVDHDASVRFTAVETLFNIAKVARWALLRSALFDPLFDILCGLAADGDAKVVHVAETLTNLFKEIISEVGPEFDSGSFIVLIHRNLSNSKNPFVRQYVLSWIQTVENVPGINLVPHLNQFLDVVIGTLSDPNDAIVNTTRSILTTYLERLRDPVYSAQIDLGLTISICITFQGYSTQNIREFVILWISELLLVGGPSLLPLAPSCLPVVLALFADLNEGIRTCAYQANDILAGWIASNEDPNWLQSDTMHELISSLISLLQNPEIATRLAVVHWVRILLEHHREIVRGDSQRLMPAILLAVSDASLDVVSVALQTASMLCESNVEESHKLIQALLQRMQQDKSCVMPRAGFIIKRLCLHLRPELVFRELALALENLTDKEFTDSLIHTCSLLLFTAQEVFSLREKLRKGVHGESAEAQQVRDVFVVLYRSWATNPVATFTLCVMCGAYEHAYQLIMFFAEMEVTVSFLVQLDQFVQLLESPAFSHVRLDLLEPLTNPCLLKLLFGVLMLLPQSSAHKALESRLACLHTIVQLHSIPGLLSAKPSQQFGKCKNVQPAQPVDDAEEQRGGDQRANSGPVDTVLDWNNLLEYFMDVQRKLRLFYMVRGEEMGGQGSFFSSNEETTTKSSIPPHETSKQVTDCAEQSEQDVFPRVDPTNHAAALTACEHHPDLRVFYPLLASKVEAGELPSITEEKA